MDLQHFLITLCSSDAGGQALHFRLDRVQESQSKPSYSPSPVVAQADWMNHWRFETHCKPSFSATSDTGIEFDRSCLFAKTNKAASRNSSSPSKLASSSWATSLRSRSLLSTT